MKVWIGLLGLLIVAPSCTGRLGSPMDDGDGGTGGSENDGGNGGSTPSTVIEDSTLLACTKPALAKTPFARLTNVQYANAVRDLIAPLTITSGITALKAETARDGFTNNAEAQFTVAEQIETFGKVSAAAGDSVAANFAKLSSALKLTACPPANESSRTACATAFIDAFGTKAFRRPLFDDERSRFKKLYDDSVAKWTFEDAVGLVAEVITGAPQFLYKIETSGSKQPDASLKLTGYEVASRLAFLIWNTLPDEALLAAAKKGELDSADGIAKEAQRLLADKTRTDPVINDFVSQWYELPKLSNGLGTKNPTLFKSYSPAVAQSMLQGLEAFVSNTLVGDGGSIEKFLTSSDAWVNKDTAPLLGSTPVPPDSKLTKVTLDSSKRKGFLTQLAFLAGMAHADVQAPVQRGVFLKTQILCQPPAQPPPNVNTSEVGPEPGTKETTRENVVRRIESKGGSCKVCHAGAPGGSVGIDPAGFLFENYNAVGQWQDREFDAPVDASAEIVGSLDLDGKYENAVQFTEKAAKSKQVQQCFVQSFYAYGLGRSLAEEDGCAVNDITKQLAADAGSFQTLITSLVKSNAFRFRTPIAE